MPQNRRQTLTTADVRQRTDRCIIFIFSLVLPRRIPVRDRKGHTALAMIALAALTLSVIGSFLDRTPNMQPCWRRCIWDCWKPTRACGSGPISSSHAAHLTKCRPQNHIKPRGPSASAIRARAKSYVVTGPTALQQSTHYRCGPNPPIMRVRAMQQLVDREQHRHTSACLLLRCGASE